MNEPIIESLARIKSGDFNGLIEITRRWFKEHCPLYTPSEVELSVGTFASRAYIRTVQLAEMMRDGVPSKRLLAPNEPFTRADADRDLLSMVSAFWNSQAMTYSRTIEREYQSPRMAETYLAEAVRNMQSRATPLLTTKETRRDH